MKSFTRIIVPILLVAGLAFGITILRLYSPDDPLPTSDPNSPGQGKGSARPLPLKFDTILAAVPKEEANDQGVKEIPARLRHLKYWDSDVEVGAPGHYVFWCQNRNDTSVVARVTGVSCQCAGADLAIVPPEAFRDYVIGSFLAGGPLNAALSPASAIVHANLNRRLAWELLIKTGASAEGPIPPADPKTGPQFALVRLTWTGKDPVGAKTITANLFAQIGGGSPMLTKLDAAINVVPSFDMIRRDETGKWIPARDLIFGELNEGAVARQEFFLTSSTRVHLLYNIASDPADPCITWSEPIPATADELKNLQDAVKGDEKSSHRLKSLYKVQVTVRERLETNVDGKKVLHTLDLGLLERKLIVSAADGGSANLALKGRVLGEVTLLGGADSGRIELGNSFPADQDKSRDVVLLAERPGLELTLSETEITPNYLKVKLEQLPPLGARNQYRLRVTVPKYSVFGALPENSAIVLKTNGPNPRRFRIPIRGMTFDSGAPRL